MRDLEDYFGSAGDMFSGSQNPEEQNDWLEKQQREQERQRKALEKQQQALNKPASGAPGFTAAPTGLTPANEPETAIPQIKPIKIEPLKAEPVKTERQETALPDFTKHWDDPLGKLPSGQVNSHLGNKYTGRAGPWDWAGRPFPRHEAEPMIENRKKDLHDMSQDMRDVLFLSNYRNDSTFRERANRAIHELNRVMPEIKADRAASEAASPLSGQGASLPASQANSGLSKVPSAKPATSSGAAATTASTPRQTDHSLANSLQATAHVNDPQDQSMGPLLDKAIDVLKGMFTDDAATPARQHMAGQPESSDVPSLAKTVPAKPPVSPAVPERMTPAVQTPDRETPVSPAGNGSSLLEQAAHVNDPQDQSYAALLQGIADFFGNALGENSAIHGRHTVGPSDESMGEAYRAGGEAVREAAQRNFVESSAVNAKGTHPPGPLDESMAELEKTGFGKMQHQAVADTHELIGEKEGFTYEPDIGAVEADAFGVGIKMVPLQIESTILSLGATFGRFLFDLFGGDPIGLEKTEARVQELEKTLEAMKPVKMNQIYVDGHPEETGRNLTRYLYQQFGNQLIKLPASWLLANAQSIAALTGVSASLLTAQINAEVIKEKGKGDPYTSAMYGVPLGLLVLMKVPFRVPFSIENAKEFGKYLGSVLVDFGVDQVQQAGVDYAAKDNLGLNKKRGSSLQ